MGQAALSPRAAHGAVEGGSTSGAVHCTARTGDAAWDGCAAGEGGRPDRAPCCLDRGLYLAV